MIAELGLLTLNCKALDLVDLSLLVQKQLIEPRPRSLKKSKKKSISTHKRCQAALSYLNIILVVNICVWMQFTQNEGFYTNAQHSPERT